MPTRVCRPSGSSAGHEILNGLASLSGGWRVTERPECRYAWNGDFAVAYHVVGDRPIDLAYLEGYGSHVDLNWESPCCARFLRGLAGHARLSDANRRAAIPDLRLPLL